MSDATVSVRVDEELHAEMKIHDEVNWSAVLRKAIVEQVSRLEQINTTQAQDAFAAIAEMRKIRIFDKGKNSTEIIREWREKRR